MNNEIIEDLIKRLYHGVELLGIQSSVSAIFYDTIDDIVTVQLVMGTDMVNFYNKISHLGILKKDDQLTITWL